MSGEKEEPEQSVNIEEEDSDDEEDEDYVPEEGEGEEGGSSEDCDFVRTIFYPHHFVVSTDPDGDDGYGISGNDGSGISGDEDEEAADSDEEGGCDSSSRKRKKVQPDVSKKEMKSESGMTAEEEKAKSDALWAELNSLSEPSSTTNQAMSSDVKGAVSLARTVKVEPSSTVTSTSASVSSSTVTKSDPQATSVSATSSSASSSSASSSSASSSLASSSSPSTPTIPVRKAGGLSNLAASLGKKKGASTLLKSKEDWETFKSESGIVEELAEHTKGKDSFVERQAFLSRADVRQFEREKEIRDKIRARRLP